MFSKIRTGRDRTGPIMKNRGGDVISQNDVFKTQNRTSEIKVKASFPKNDVSKN